MSAGTEEPQACHQTGRIRAPVTSRSHRHHMQIFVFEQSWRDNVFVERFWRTVKYEKVYLKAYEGLAEARLRRPHD
jgi:hypothetical protein